MSVQVCFDRDRECGSLESSWCDTCPNRARTGTTAAVVTQMQTCVDDPMWAEHVEIPKALLRSWVMMLNADVGTLERIDDKALAGLCSMTHTGAREFLKDIRKIVTNQKLIRGPAAPIDMVLFCPHCGVQHIDAPDEPSVDECPATGTACRMAPNGPNGEMQCEFCASPPHWTNPPHRTHLCRPQDGGCGKTWRPAMVTTNGVLQLPGQTTEAEALKNLYGEIGMPLPDGVRRTVSAPRDIRVAAKALADRLRLIETSPEYQAVFVLTANRGMPYTGPNYAAELKALDSVLIEPQD